MTDLASLQQRANSILARFDSSGIPVMLGEDVVDIETLVDTIEGLDLIFDEDMLNRGRLAEYRPDKNVIIVHPKLLKPEYSRLIRFVVAHEFAHYIYHRELLSQGVLPGFPEESAFRQIAFSHSVKRSIERVANSFATCLLIPCHEIVPIYESVFASYESRLSIESRRLAGTRKRWLAAFVCELIESLMTKFELPKEVVTFALHLYGLYNENWEDA